VANARRINATTCGIDVSVIATDEEAVIARATHQLTDGPATYNTN